MAQEEIIVDVARMQTSRGTDYYTCISCGGRVTTPFVFQERWKAQWEADHLAWVLGLRAEEPCVLDYGPESHPND